jgi:hypothetical protein
MFCANVRHRCRCLEAVGRELIRMKWRLGVAVSIAIVNIRMSVKYYWDYL